MAYLFKPGEIPGHPKKKRKKTHSPYKAAFNLLVSVFSFFIRLREAKRTGRCFICLNAPVEHCYHFIPCTNKAIRFEPDNACGSCSGCNYGENMNRGNAILDARVRAAHVRMVGEARVRELEAMKHNYGKKSAAELRDMAAYFKNLMAGGK